VVVAFTNVLLSVGIAGSVMTGSSDSGPRVRAAR
jgi:hypothetical protein